MQTIHKKAKTSADKFAKLPLQYQKQFLELLQSYAPKAIDNPAEDTVIAGAKAVTKTTVVKQTKPKMLIVKLYNSKTNAHEELELIASDYCDMSLSAIITDIRADFPASDWSFKIRIPVGL